MNRFSESELSRKIDDSIVEHLQTGEPTVDEVSETVIHNYDHLIREHGYDLAVSQIRSIVCGRMKKVLATRKGHALQLRLSLSFGEMEPESAITFRDADGAIRYVAMARATAEHHQQYILLLRDQIQADTDRLSAAEMFYAWLEPAFRKHPCITTAEAIEILEPEGQGA
jgi:hypothetical protein